MQIKALLFDLDGVIVDTAKHHFLAWKELADKLGIEFTKKDNERLKGVNRMRCLEIILSLENLTFSSSEKETFCQEKNENYLNLISYLTEEDVLPNVREFILDAHEQGYKIALGSASKNSRFILEKLNLLSLFDVVVDGTSVKEAKPNPEVFLFGAKELEVEAKECLVFEDAFSGIEAAHRAGMIAVGVGKPENLPEAELCIESFEGINIKQLINKLLKKM